MAAASPAGGGGVGCCRPHGCLGRSLPPVALDLVFDGRSPAPLAALLLTVTLIRSVFVQKGLQRVLEAGRQRVRPVVVGAARPPLGRVLKDDLVVSAEVAHDLLDRAQVEPGEGGRGA
jgi:hypothetical protein